MADYYNNQSLAQNELYKPVEIDVEKTCPLWDENCTGDREEALTTFFNDTYASLLADTCFGKVDGDRRNACKSERVPAATSSLWQSLRSWMRQPECTKAWTEAQGKVTGIVGTGDCCGECDVGGPNVDIYYWPSPDADTSCLSIIGDKVRPPLEGATTTCARTKKCVTYWGYTPEGYNIYNTEVTTRVYTSIGDIYFNMAYSDPWEGKPGKSGGAMTFDKANSHLYQLPSPDSSTKVGKRYHARGNPIPIYPRAVLNSSYPRSGTVPPSHSSIVTHNGHTFTSPSIYIDFYSLHATDSCGYRGAKDYIDSTMIAYDPEELSTIAAPLKDFIEKASVPTSRYNFANLPCPPESVMRQQWYKPSPGDPYRPAIAFPPRVLDVDPMWKGCATKLFVGLDPPRTLEPAAIMANPVPTIDPGPIAEEAAPAPTPDRPAKETAKKTAAALVPEKTPDPKLEKKPDPQPASDPKASEDTDADILDPGNADAVGGSGEEIETEEPSAPPQAPSKEEVANPEEAPAMNANMDPPGESNLPQGPPGEETPPSEPKQGSEALSENGSTNKKPGTSSGSSQKSDPKSQPGVPVAKEGKTSILQGTDQRPKMNEQTAGSDPSDGQSQGADNNSSILESESLPQSTVPFDPSKVSDEMMAELKEALRPASDNALPPNGESRDKSRPEGVPNSNGDVADRLDNPSAKEIPTADGVATSGQVLVADNEQPGATQDPGSAADSSKLGANVSVPGEIGEDPGTSNAKTTGGSSDSGMKNSATGAPSDEQENKEDVGAIIAGAFNGPARQGANGAPSGQPEGAVGAEQPAKGPLVGANGEKTPVSGQVSDVGKVSTSQDVATKPVIPGQEPAAEEPSVNTANVDQGSASSTTGGGGAIANDQDAGTFCLAGEADCLHAAVATASNLGAASNGASSPSTGSSSPSGGASGGKGQSDAASKYAPPGTNSSASPTIRASATGSQGAAASGTNNTTPEDIDNAAVMSHTVLGFLRWIIPITMIMILR